MPQPPDALDCDQIAGKRTAVAQRRFIMLLLGSLSAIALALAMVGIYGVISFSVSERTQEIGIRMALGARKGQVLLLVLREGMALVAAGTLLGFLGAFGLSNMLSALTSVFVDALKVGTGDLRLLIGAPLPLAGLALLACYIPARRATKIDPLNALREG